MDQNSKTILINKFAAVECRLEHMDKLISTLVEVSEKNLYSGYFVEIPPLLKMQISRTRKDVSSILNEFS